MKVIANGKNEVISIEIKPEAVDPEDVEMLQDLITAAVNEALRKRRKWYPRKWANLRWLKIPGLL